MDQATRNKVQVPGGGEYFYRLDNMLDAHKDSGKQGFAVAADKNSFDKRKCYGLYPSMTAFLIHLMACPTRYLYEVLTNHTKCRGFADVEWKQPTKGPDWPWQMDMILDHLRMKAMRMYGVDAEFKVLVSSREDDGLWKYSFHIIITNLVFNNNHDGTMHSFFTVTDDMGRDWFWDDKGTQKAIMDQRVYDSNRCFRLPYCCKKGTNSPMLPLKSPFHEMQLDDNTDPEHLVEFTVTHMSQQYTLVPSIEPSPVLKSKASRTPSQRPAVSFRVDPAVASTLEKLLADAGDTVSKVSKVNYNPDDDTYFIQCQNNNHIRKCLCDSTRSHDSNNCILRLTSQPGGYQCRYTCCHPDCKKLGSLSLGFVSLDAMPDNSIPDNTSDFNRPIDQLYCDENCKPRPNKRAVAIRSPCGSGKTKQITQGIADENSEATVQLIVSHRVNLSKKVVETFPLFKGRKCEMYNELKGDIDLEEHPYLAIQFESLSRLQDFLNPDLKINLILDEWCSISKQMHSKCGNPIKTQAVFAALIKLSHQVTAMDAYLDQPHLDIFESYLGEPGLCLIARTQHQITNPSAPSKQPTSWSTNTRAGQIKKLNIPTTKNAQYTSSFI